MLAQRKAIILHLWEPRKPWLHCWNGHEIYKTLLFAVTYRLCILNAVRVCKRNLSLWPTDRKHGCSLWIGVGLSRASHCRRRVIHLLSWYTAFLMTCPHLYLDPTKTLTSYQVGHLNRSFSATRGDLPNSALLPIQAKIMAAVKQMHPWLLILT